MNKSHKNNYHERNSLAIMYELILTVTRMLICTLTIISKLMA